MPPSTATTPASVEENCSIVDVSSSYGTDQSKVRRAQQQGLAKGRAAKGLMRSLSCIPGCVRGDEESYITSNAMTGETVFDMARLRVASAGAAPGANASAAAMRHESAKAVLIYNSSAGGFSQKAEA